MSELITVGYSTRKHNPEFIEYLKKSSGFKKINVIEKINNGEKSLAQTYNEILNESETNIVVLCHDDISFDTTSWYSKIMKHFEKSDFGILGVAGTTYMPSSGQWWEDRSKMVGIVNHEHEGKKWESKYSESLENRIKEVVIVDGLFMVIDKRKIKKIFDEEFKGFHFYDIPFCFSNHIEGVKVGVITNIRITHKSIGQTNEQWEMNKVYFANKFQNDLPKRIPFNPNEKLKILLTCLFFKTFTGSELYVYELAKNLINQNCEVTVLSDIGGPLTDLAKKQGIKVLSHTEPPGYKLGDGKWGFNTPQGFQASQENMLYKVSEVNYDIVHIQHKPVAERMVQLYPNIPKVYTIHSEVINLEDPIKHESIKKYVAIRPEIKEHIVGKFDIPDNDVEIIYNPIDETKFKVTNSTNKNYILFVGSIDYLREKTINDLVEKTKEDGLELWLVGENKSNYLETLLKNNNVKYFPATWNVETYIKHCKETAGIQLGRTTIEGWMCGKPGWIYKVDENGDILNKNYFEPPSDIEKYYSSAVVENIKKEYIKILS
jgi:glycosyltransferase involved in cell wall biosynthesis